MLVYARSAYAKCTLKLALAEPAATPHKALSTLLKLRMTTRIGLGNTGERQSKTKPKSLRTSANKRYILHSGSSADPKR